MVEKDYMREEVQRKRKVRMNENEKKEAKRIFASRGLLENAI